MFTASRSASTPPWARYGGRAGQIPSLASVSSLLGSARYEAKALRTATGQPGTARSADSVTLVSTHVTLGLGYRVRIRGLGVVGVRVDELGVE